ncbi:MAG: DsbA family protein [Deltaproteobacteria bacterium]|nr:DsbA family protein [Deltaproteobacteria bacterium]
MRLRLISVIVVLVAVLACCCRRQPGPDGGPNAPQTRVQLPGVDVSSLDAREHVEWSALVNELLAPCPDVAVSVAQCVQEKRACPTCTPAAQFLLRQVQAARPKSDIVEVFADRFDPGRVKTIVVGDSASKGPEDAAVTIVEFADFGCPGCMAASNLLDKLYETHGGTIRLVFKHYPLEMHRNAKLAAQAAHAAQLQGRFWPMHRILFENRTQLGEPDLLTYAAKIGLDLDRFRADLHGPATATFVAREKQQGDSLGLRYTPTIYINGRECQLGKLANPLRDLEEWVEVEVALAAGGHLPQPPSPAPAPSPSASQAVPPPASAPPVPATAAPSTSATPTSATPTSATP